MDSAAPQILIVDDARDIRDPLGQYLRKQGFRTHLAANAGEARRFLDGSQPALIVLDVMMPGEDGLSLCRWLVAHGGPPVILLTAMAEETDRIVGLELGADDYMIKPFNPRELVARIRAVLRRSPPPEPKVPTGRRRFSTWLHDPAAQELRHADGHRVELTSGENRLLGVLLDHPQTVMSRDRLLDLTAGLGGGSRKLADQLGLWVTGMEADGDLADAAAQLSLAAGMKKKADVVAFDPEDLELPNGKFHGALIREALYRIDDRERILHLVYDALKPRAALSFTDLALADDGALDNPKATIWRDGEPGRPTPSVMGYYPPMLEAMGFEVRVHEDATPEYVSHVLAGWGAFVKNLDRRLLDRDFVNRMMHEARFWLARMRALESGDLRFVRVLATKADG